MTWNYRIVRHAETALAPEYFAIHEVYYEGDREDAVTVEPIAAVGDTAEDVVETLKLMLRDAKRYAVIDYDAIGVRRE